MFAIDVLVKAVVLEKSPLPERCGCLFWGWRSGWLGLARLVIAEGVYEAFCWGRRVVRRGASGNVHMAAIAVVSKFRISICGWATVERGRLCFPRRLA